MSCTTAAWSRGRAPTGGTYHCFGRVRHRRRQGGPRSPARRISDSRRPAAKAAPINSWILRPVTRRITPYNRRRSTSQAQFDGRGAVSRSQSRSSAECGQGPTTANGASAGVMVRRTPLASRHFTAARGGVAAEPYRVGFRGRRSAPRPIAGLASDGLALAKRFQFRAVDRGPGRCCCCSRSRRWRDRRRTSQARLPCRDGGRPVRHDKSGHGAEQRAPNAPDLGNQRTTLEPP
jgi:hypothetical protein